MRGARFEQVTPSRAFAISSVIDAGRPATSNISHSKFSPCDCGRWQQRQPEPSSRGEVIRGHAVMPCNVRSPYRGSACDGVEESSQAVVRSRRYSSLRNAVSTVDAPFNVSPRTSRSVQQSKQSRSHEQGQCRDVEISVSAAIRNGTIAWFLQKDVSVITCRNIRYEGKLCSVDTVKATITLQNVRNMGTEQRVASIKVQPASDFYGFIVFNVDYIKSFQPITICVTSRSGDAGDHYVVPSLLTTSGTSFAKVNEDKCIADSKSGVYSSPKGTVLSSYRALATISKKCDSVQGDCQRLRSTDVNRPAANDRIVFKKNGHYVSHQQQQQTNKVNSNLSGNKEDRLKNSKTHKDGDSESRNRGNGLGYNDNSSSNDNSNCTNKVNNGSNKEWVLKPNTKVENAAEQKINTDRNLPASNTPKDEKGSRHVSFMNPDQLAESRSDIRRLSHIPQVPRCFMSGYGNRNNTYLGRSKRHKQENGINSQNKILALPRRQRSGSQYKPGEFAKPKTTMKFQVEFDFDKALEEFKELSLNDSKCHAKDPKQASSDSAKSSMESNDSATNEPKECYNREKCFYDNLSNASLTPGQLRRSRKDEIMVNRETFGVSWIPLRRRYFHIRPGFYGNGKRFHGGRNFDRRASGKN